MITLFCELYRTKVTDELQSAWEKALQRYQDSQVIPAGQALMEQAHRMPTPADLIERIKLSDPPEELQDGVEAYAHCSKCGKWRWCRKEAPRHQQFECEDCYTGLDAAGRKQRYRDLMVKMGWAPGPKKQQQEAA
jgi:hypothetical protein